MALDKTCGSHFYLDAIHFKDCKAHRDVMKQVLGLPEKNAAIKHYYDNYNTPAQPPVWTVLEAMTIGQLSRLFSDLHLDHRKTVAAKFGYDESVLVTWLKSLTILRNVCAHHGRMWNASITADAPKYAKAIATEFPSHNDRGRIFARAVGRAWPGCRLGDPPVLVLTQVCDRLLHGRKKCKQQCFTSWLCSGFLADDTCLISMR